MVDHFLPLGPAPPGVPGPAIPEVDLGGVGAGFEEDGDDTAKGTSQKAESSPTGKKTRIRTEFPETWLWIDSLTE